MTEAIERLRPRLVTFRDERGRELFDLPVAPRPDPDTPAPPRFLPGYDNVLLSHADRSRIVSEAHRERLTTSNGRSFGTVLVDGFVSATWRIGSQRGRATLLTRSLERLSKQEREAMAQEGARLLAFAAALNSRRPVYREPGGLNAMRHVAVRGAAVYSRQRQRATRVSSR